MVFLGLGAKSALGAAEEEAGEERHDGAEGEGQAAARFASLGEFAEVDVTLDHADDDEEASPAENDDNDEFPGLKSPSLFNTLVQRSRT